MIGQDPRSRTDTQRSKQHGSLNGHSAPVEYSDEPRPLDSSVGSDHSFTEEMPPGPVHSWDTEDCCRWLLHIRMTQYESLFRTQKVT
jgi:hypothetical protein